MTDKTLGSLPDGGAVAAGDIGYVERGGNSRKVNPSIFDSLALENGSWLTGRRRQRRPQHVPGQRPELHRVAEPALLR